MDGGNRGVEQSKALLKRSFLPRVQLRVRRHILARLASDKLATIPKPDAHVLQRSPLLASWTTQSIAKLLAVSRLEYKRAGMVAAYCHEPQSFASIYWVVSGKLTQVPAKQEVMHCSIDVFGPSPGLGKMIPTGPLVFPALFGAQAGREQAPGVGGEATLSAQQEAVLDSLQTYSSAQLVDGDALVLGDSRQRCVRCQSDAVLLAIPLSAVLAELSSAKPAVRQATIAAAREAVVARLVKNSRRPSVNAILNCNYVLQGLSMRAAREIWGQLRPRVCCAGERICADVFTSDTVYFLGRGQVTLSACAAGGGRVERRHAAGVGVNSFASYELPERFGEQRVAEARSYCELWSAPLSVFVAACDAGDEVSCARRAAALAAQTPISRTHMNLAGALAQVPAFSSLSEASLQAVARAMRLRVHPPGKAIVPHAHDTPVKEGVVVLCGRCSTTTTGTVGPDKGVGGRRGKPDTVMAPRPGVASFFCEALLSRPILAAVHADTSVLALHASPGAMLDALEDLSEFELRTVIDAANEHIISVYGARYGVHEETPQERAAARVQERAAQQRAAKAPQKSDALATDAGEADAELSHEKVAENGILASLALQLQSLHYDGVVAKRHGFFHDPIERRAKMLVSTATAEQGGTPCAGREGPRSGGCFTLDASGELVFVEHGWKEGRGDASPPPPHTAQLPAHPHIPDPPPEDLAPPSAQVAETPAAQPHQRRNEASTRERPAAADRLSRPLPVIRPVETRQLQVPIALAQRGRGDPTWGQRTAERPPRLAALRHTAAHLKNEADGFFTEAELLRAKRKAYTRR